MEDGVKYIFKTLLRVPIIIYVSFAIMNAFAFCFAYFKMLGVSYVLQQAVVENNYLDEENFNHIYSYVESIDTRSDFIDEAAIVVDDSDTKVDTWDSSVGSMKRTQYGNVATVGVAYKFRVIWPFDYRHVYTESGMDASDGHRGKLGGYTEENRKANMADRQNRTDFKTGSKLNADTKASWDTLTLSRNDIVIKYTVPGLRYYPDLSNS